MGIAISGWPLARAVSKAGQLGVVSGTAIDAVFVRRLQNEGVSEALRAVLDRFPVPSIVERVVAQFAQTRHSVAEKYQNLVMLTHRSNEQARDLLVLASYAEVALAKEGHDGKVGINLLTKVQLPTAPTLLGAILADVDYVVMGAGVPTHIPGTLTQLAAGEPVEMPLDVAGDEPSTLKLRFVPVRYLPTRVLRAPKFLGIVSSHVLATALARRSNGPVEGFVVERPSAGGHNAPPRGAFAVDERGEPLYGARDEVDYGAMVDLERPFWIGGSMTHAKDVRRAQELGATGVQVGTLFAYCDESGMQPMLRAGMLKEIAQNDVRVTTSLRASSTGYPFKVVNAPGTLAVPSIYETRKRKCDLGYLREAYAKADGAIGYRCAAEPVADYVRKGGRAEDTEGCVCLCNGLMATCGLGQVRADARREPPVLTSGDAIRDVRELLAGRLSYSANDVIDYLSVGSATSE